MDSNPQLENADLEFRSARLDYRNLLKLVQQRRLRDGSADEFLFAEKCFSSAEKTLKVRSRRSFVDSDTLMLQQLSASASQAREELLGVLAHAAPSLSGVDAIRRLYGTLRAPKPTSPPSVQVVMRPGDLLLLGLAVPIVGLMLFHC